MSTSQFFYVACFIISVLILVLCARYRISYGNYPNLCEQSQALLLCGQKRALEEASVGDLALIDGISLRMARHIKQSKITNLDNLIALKGIGPKTVLKLKKYFY